MPESKPLTAAERDELRQLLADDLPFYDIQKIVPDVLRRLLDERDTLAARVAAQGDVLPDLIRLLDEKKILLTQLAEARGIAGRLANVLDDAYTMLVGEGMQSDQAADALSAFDALHWPDPPE